MVTASSSLRSALVLNMLADVLWDDVGGDFLLLIETAQIPRLLNVKADDQPVARMHDIFLDEGKIRPHIIGHISFNGLELFEVCRSFLLAHV